MTLAGPTLATLLGMPGAMLRAPWLPPERLARLQWWRLERLLDHAHAHSPLWRERFASMGAVPRDIRGPADFARLPVTTREDLRSPEALLARGFDAGFAQDGHDLRLDRPAHHDLFRPRRLVRRQASPEAARAAGLRHAADRPGRPVPGGRSGAPADTPRRPGAHLLDPRAAGKRDRGRGPVRPGYPLRLSWPSPAVGDGRSRQGPAAADLHLGRAAGRGDPAVRSRRCSAAKSTTSTARPRPRRSPGNARSARATTSMPTGSWSRPPPPRIRRGAPPTASW